MIDSEFGNCLTRNPKVDPSTTGGKRRPNTPTGKGSKGLKGNTKGKKGIGGGKGLGVVTVVTAFAVPVGPEIEFVSSVAKKRGFNESCDESYPFDV